MSLHRGLWTRVGTFGLVLSPVGPEPGTGSVSAPHFHEREGADAAWLMPRAVCLLSLCLFAEHSAQALSWKGRLSAPPHGNAGPKDGPPCGLDGARSAPLAQPACSVWNDLESPFLPGPLASGPGCLQARVSRLLLGLVVAPLLKPPGLDQRGPRGASSPDVNGCVGTSACSEPGHLGGGVQPWPGSLQPLATPRASPEWAQPQSPRLCGLPRPRRAGFSWGSCPV